MALPTYISLPECVATIGSRIRMIEHIRRNIQELFGVSAAQAEKFKYQLPCSNPQSIAAHTFQTWWAHEGTLVCTPKADGVRYSLYFLQIQEEYFVVAIDRKYQCTALPLQLPIALQHWYMESGTLLDTELVLDMATGRPYFLVFDVIVLAGHNMRLKPTAFLERQRLLAAEPLADIRFPPPFLPMTLKTYQLMPWGTPLHLPPCTYATDGLICFPTQLGIVVGRSASLIRLKKTETLDVAYTMAGTFALHHAGVLEAISVERDKLHITNPHHLPLQAHAIYECTVALHPSTGLLEATVMLLRNDKVEPNDITTLHQLQACLRDPVC